MEKMKERVLDKSFKKVYNRKEVKHWVNFGIQNRYVDKTDKKDIIDWIKLLDNKNINI
jgi:hypothetical protein